MDTDLRKVERYEEEEWVEVDFNDLKAGDVFRMFDQPEEPVVDNEGFTTWRCTTDPYPIEGHESIPDGIPTVQVEGVTV